MKKRKWNLAYHYFTDICLITTDPTNAIDKTMAFTPLRNYIQKAKSVIKTRETFMVRIPI